MSTARIAQANNGSLDTLLSTVQNLRVITDANIDDLPPRPTFSILLPLFSALGLGCSADADIL